MTHELLSLVKKVVNQFPSVVHFCKHFVCGVIIMRSLLTLKETFSIYFEVRNVNSFLLRLGNTGIVSSEDVEFWTILGRGMNIQKSYVKLNKSYFVINNLKRSLHVESILNVYYNLVYSHLQYNILLWGTSIEVNCKLSAQKKIFRMVFIIRPLDSCKPFFVAHNILTVPCIYIGGLLCNGADHSIDTHLPIH